MAGHDGLDDCEPHSLDGAQFYRIFACASEAFAEGKLDAATLRDSEARLMGVVPVD